MRRVMLAAAAVVLLLAGYVVADVADLVPGVLTRAEAPPSPVVPLPSPSGDTLLTATGEDAPQPTDAGLVAAVEAAAQGAGLEGTLGVSVRDGISGAELAGVRPSVPRVPASTVKLLSAVAVADTLDLGARIPTTVVATSGSTDLVLVCRGDMFLARGRGDPDAVLGRAGLGDLADQVAGALREAGRTTVSLRLDLSFAPGPRVPPTWNPNDVRDGFAGPVVMTGLAAQRALPSRPAPARPDVEVATAFVDLLAARRVTATLEPERTWTRAAPGSARPLGTVESATYGELLEHALDVSDNSLAESLVRQAAATAGEPTAAAGANAAFVRSRLAADAIPVPGLRLVDASGLSPGQRVAPTTLSAVLARAVTGASPPLEQVVAGLPVAGLDGTLSGRFGEKDARDVVGVPRAKTGTLRQGSALAGTTVTADGRPLAFAVLVDGYPQTFAGTEEARKALDAIVAALTRCGCR